ncbi:MAG: TIGR02996 domain-containing protein [Planctomycetales bacterium]
MDEQAFLREIAANPGDDPPRLIFADWLGERGDFRADLLRLLDELLHIEVTDRATQEARVALRGERLVSRLMLNCEKRP